jgi:hypothetical protein
MEAVKISTSLYKYLEQQGDLTGKIHSCFDNAFNIIDQNDVLIGVLSHNKELSPFSLKVNKESLNQLGIQQGQEIQIKDKAIYFRGRKLKIALSEYDLVDLRLDKHTRCLIDNDKLNLLKSIISTQGSNAGIAPLINLLSIDSGIEYSQSDYILNDYCEFIQERLLELLKGLDTGVSDDSYHLMLKIIGFGPGLTPSADDFLSGVLSVIHVCDLDSYHLRTMIKELIKNKTTKISEDMIHHTLDGLVSESYQRFIEVLFDETKKDITKEAMDVIRIGSTSGTDYLFGVYCMTSLISVKEAKNDQI